MGLRPAALVALALALLLPGCAKDAPLEGLACDAPPAAPDPAWKAEAPRITVETTAGAFAAELYEERAPRTVANFLDLASAGVYDGTSFHRVVKGFVIQGGDPNSKNADPQDDGLGGPGYSIPDEFNPTLRHDAAGVLSMASAGPDTGGSQFFVTLAATPQLDDRHSAFGRVTQGMEVVRAIGSASVDEDDRPTSPVRVTRVATGEPLAYDALHEVGVRPVMDAKVTEGGRDVRFAIVLQNKGNVRDQPTLHAEPPAGWGCVVGEAPVVPAGTGRVVLLTLRPPADANGTVDVPLTLESAWPNAAKANASVRVVLGKLGGEVQAGDRVTANYAGLLLDGRVFDTSIARVAQDAALPKLTSPGGFKAHPRYEPFTFTVGQGVIPGFTKLAEQARVGETVVGVVPKEDAYATGDMYDRPLVKRDLVFELEVLT